MGDSWASRILKGKDVVASGTFNELNGNLIVGFVLKETAIPNLNPYQIMKTVQFLTREAKSNEERMKTQGIPAPTAAAAPAASAAPAPEATASVPQEEMSDEDIRASYRVTPKPQEDSIQPIASQPTSSPARPKGKEPKLVTKTGRVLKPIPGASEAASAAVAAPAASAPVSKPAVMEKVVPREEPVPKRVEKAPEPATAPVSEAASSDRLVAIEKKLTNIEGILEKLVKK
ncbi:MAG: hypothetical protein ACFFCS_23685, partial [Candidatus Hodarchaeota archaeon]